MPTLDDFAAQVRADLDLPADKPFDRRAFARWVVDGDAPNAALIEYVKRIEPWQTTATANRVLDSRLVRASTDMVEAAALWWHERWAEDPSRPHPLAPLISAYYDLSQPPQMGVVERRRQQIMPAVSYQVPNGDPRAREQLYLPAHHSAEASQLVLPGFGLERNGAVTPALPVAWYDLGSTGRPRSRAAPLALRLMVMALRATTLDHRRDMRIIEFTRADFQQVFAPRHPDGRARKRSGRQLRATAEAAAESLASIDARLPTKIGLWQLVVVRSLPRWDVEADDVMRLDVTLPPDVAGNGPRLPSLIDEYGMTSSARYRAALNVAAHLHHPGRTGHGVPYRETLDPRRYPELNDADALALVYPSGTPYGRRYDYVARAWETLRQLDSDGVMTLHGRRVLSARLRTTLDELPDDTTREAFMEIALAEGYQAAVARHLPENDTQT